MTVNIHEAKTQFSKLIRRVLQGEEIVIARAGRSRDSSPPCKSLLGGRPDLRADG